MDIFAKITKEREERTQDLHLDLSIPTWDGALVARFAVIPRPEMEAFANRKRNTDSDIDFLIRCCDSIWVIDTERQLEGTRMKENEDYVRVDGENGNALKFEQEFGIKIGMTEADAERARNVVLHCFKGNGIAIGGFVGKLSQWLMNTDARVADAIVGE